MYKLILSLSIVLFSFNVFAGPYWMGGTITEHTAVTEGLLIKVSGGLPDNCTGAAFAWLIIPEAKKTIMAITLLSLLENKNVVVYTSGLQNYPYCEVTQVDPEG